MIIYREKRPAGFIKRMMRESLEFNSLEQARDVIFSHIKKTFSKFRIDTQINTNSKIVIFGLTGLEFKLSLWWQGMKSPSKPYMISDTGPKWYYANNFNDAMTILQRIAETWRPPESNLNMGRIIAAIHGARLSSHKEYKYFGFRGDNKRFRQGQILGTSSNGMGSLSVTGVGGKLPGTSTIGIPFPANSPQIALAWRAFTSVQYGKYHSLVGGRSSQLGDDVIETRMGGKNYDVDEYVIEDAEVLLLL